MGTGVSRDKRDGPNCPTGTWMQAHSAPLDLLFYAGGSFPNDVIVSLFVTFHGSWERSPVTGYKVV